MITRTDLLPRSRHLMTCLLAVLLCHCQRKQALKHDFGNPDVLAFVGEAKITKADFLEFTRERRLENLEQAEAALRALIDEESLAQLAKHQKLDQKPQFRAAMRRLLLSQLLEATPSLDGAKISEAALQDAYTKSSSRFTVPSRRDIAILRQTVSLESGREEATTRIREAQAALPSIGKDEPGFGPLAVTFSDDNDSRYQGGRVGWVVEGQEHPLLPAEVIAAAAALTSPGQISEPIATKSSVYLIKLIAFQPSKPMPFDQVKDRLRMELAAENSKKTRSQLIEAAKNHSPSVIELERLKAVLNSDSSKPDSAKPYELLLGSSFP